MSDNTASNLGTGQGIFAQKVGDDLQFKGLVGGTNVTLTADANNITITASNDTTALNLGTGSGLFTSKSGDNLQLRSIIANAASGISVTTNSNDLTFQLVSANVDAGKLGGVAASDFLRKSDNLASLASAATARTNLDVYSKAEIDANVIRNNANVLPDADSTYSLGSNSYKWLNIYADNFYGRASVAGSIDSITNIGDVDTSGAVNGSVLKYNSSNGNWEVGTDLSGGGGGGSATFVGLTDTPANLTGDAGKFVRVNSGETALEFTTDVATQTYVNTQVANLVDSAPGTLDTLNELAAALGDDANFSTTITNSIATKLATADFDTTFDNRLATKSTTNLTEGTNLYYTDARVDTHLNQSNPTSGYVLSWNGSDYAWVANGGTGDISRVNITAGTGLTGTQDTTTGDHTQTLAVDVGTTANKIVQLDGSGRLPAVDGSQLTGVSTATTIAALTDTTIGTAANGEVLFYNGSAWVDQALTTDNVSEGANLYYTNARADARIGAANISDLANVHTAAPTDGQVLKWDNGNSRWAPANDTDTVYTSFNSDFDTRLASKDTGDVAEGSNLYFTNARADARISAASLTALSNVDAVTAGDDGKVLYYDHSSTSFKWKVDATGGSSYGNSDVDAHLNQSNPTAGYVLSWNGSDYAWVDNGTTGATTFTGLTDTPANYTSSASRFVKVNSAGNGLEFVADPGYLTSVPAQSFASLTGKPTTIAGYGITDAYDNTDFDTRLASKDTGDLTEGSNLYFTNARADARITAAGSANWNTAYGWGDHGAAGYQTSAGLNAAIDSHLNQSNPTSGYVLSWNGSDYAWVTNAGYTHSDFDNRFATKTTDNLTEGASNLYFTNARARAAISEGSAQLSYNSGTGVLTFTQGDTDTVAEGSTNLYFTNARADARADARIAAADTDALSEGSTNLYFTNARADARVNLQTGANLDLSSKNTGDLTEGSNLYFTDARADARITNALIDEDNMASNSATRIPSQQSVKAYVDSQVASENELSEMNDVTISSIQNNQFLKYNSSSSRWENATVTAASAAGSDTYVQFNDGGVMGGDAGFVYNKTTDALTVGSVTTTGSSPQVSAAGNLGISTTASNGNITFTPHGTGDVVLSANVKIDGSDNDYLKWTAPYSTEGDLPSASTYHGMFAHVHGTGKGYFAHGGNWIKLLDETSSTTANLTEGSNLYYTDARARAAISEGSAQLSYNSSTGVLTFTQDDTDGIAEGSTNLYFTNARADARITAAGSANWNTAYGWGDHSTAGYLTSVPAQSFASLTGKPTTIAGYGITDAFDNTDFDTRLATKDTDDVAEGSTNLYYTDARADTRATLRIGAADLSALNNVHNATPTDGQVLTWDNGNSRWAPATPSGGGSSLTVQDEGSALATAATTINFVGAGVTASGTGATKTITISGGGGGSSGTEYEEFKINYATNGNITSISDTSSGISGVNIDSATGGDLTVTFTGYTTPPLSFAMYGYNYTANEYNYNTVASGSMTVRKVPGGGSSGSPTAFGSFSTMTIRCSESETGASRSFGTTTHAWVRFVMGA